MKCNKKDTCANHGKKCGECNAMSDIHNHYPNYKEIKRGHWTEKCIRGGFAEEWAYVCSECGCQVSDRSGLGKYQGKNQQLNYCPNCGVEMEEK